MDKNKIKVCHLTSAHNQLDVRIFYKECVSLAANGYDTYLVSRGDYGELNNVHLIGCGEFTGTRFSRMTKFSNKVYKRALEIDADIYHLHDPELLQFAKRLKRKGKIVIFDSHEFYVEQIKTKEYLSLFSKKVIANLFEKYQSKIFCKIDAVIVPCTLNGINVFEEKAKNVTFIANYPINSEFFDNYDSKIEKKDYICYIGGLTNNRGITYLIKAASIASTPLVLVGNFLPESYYDKVKTMPEFKNVDYRGYVSRKEVCNINAQAIAGLCTLLNFGQYNSCDTFSIKVFEYMAMGIPVILNKSFYNDKVNNYYHFGITVVPNDVKQIANAIIYLNEHPNEAKQMGLNGRRAVEEEFNWETQEKKLLSLYQKLITDNIGKNNWT